MKSQTLSATEPHSRVVGDVSAEVRVLAAERKRIWETLRDAVTDEECKAVMRQVEEITGRINAELERGCIEADAPPGTARCQTCRGWSEFVVKNKRGICFSCFVNQGSPGWR